MDKSEFKKFWAELTQLFPFDVHNTESEIKAWWDCASDLDLTECLRYIRRKSVFNSSCVKNLQYHPTIDNMKEQVAKYHGYGDLMHKALMQKSKEY